MCSLTEVLKSVASEFVIQTMCLVGVQVLSVELLAFPVTNILYVLNKCFSLGIRDTLFKSWGGREIWCFHHSRRHCGTWNKFVLLCGGNS